MGYKSNLKELITEEFSEMVRIRRHLHQYPEISYNEYETTKLIVEKLENLGYRVEQPLETGCIGVLEGASIGPVIALRADIDALPMSEEGSHKAEFLSRNPGAAHCCGHDVHTANLLGTAALLARLKSQINGRVVLIFQPGEEKLPGGARLLMETGILDKLGVQVIFGLHTYHHLPAGSIAVKKGPFMARPDEFTLTMTGTGGHAAAPHQTVDPVVMAAQVITNAQSIVSRMVNPLEPAVLTFGKIAGGSAHNVIPERVEMLGTIRTFRKELAQKIAASVESVARGVSEASGGGFKFTFSEGYPAVINDDYCTEIVIKTAKSLGDITVHELTEPLMAGEDFSFYLEKYPGSFFYLGSGGESTGSVYNWHHPNYNCDENAMLTGSALLASIVLNPDNIPIVKSK